MSGPLSPRSPTGALTIENDSSTPIDMHTYAWNMLDLTELWIFQATRGSNVLIPGVDGMRPYPRRIDEARHSLEMAITGWCDKDGVPYSDPWVGLEANINYLRTNVVRPPPPPQATRDAVLTMPSGGTRSATIQVLDLRLGHHGKGELMAATLEIVIPGGRFLVGGS